MASLSEKQKRFADYYIETGNIYQSAIKAGYSETYAKAQAHKLLENVGIKNYIDERLKELEGKRIASAAEVMQLLTSAMRGELEEEIVVGDGVTIKKKIGLKDRIKAAELIGKRHRLFTDKVQVEGVLPVMIVGEDEIED